jgi:hypothetical protein
MNVEVGSVQRTPWSSDDQSPLYELVGSKWHVGMWGRQLDA